jgi:hypothetical protein
MSDSWVEVVELSSKVSWRASERSWRIDPGLGTLCSASPKWLFGSRLRISWFVWMGEFSSLRKEGMAAPLDEAVVGERRYGR